KEGQEQLAVCIQLSDDRLNLRGCEVHSNSIVSIQKNLNNFFTIRNNLVHYSEGVCFKKTTDRNKNKLKKLDMVEFIGFKEQTIFLGDTMNYWTILLNGIRSYNKKASRLNVRTCAL
ncbi:hypothetical protein BpHYR1_011165, partial [Brachionus plicatilis]